MKKIIAMLAIASLAVSAQSAQINWGSGGNLFNGTQQMNTANGYSTQAYLVYLGTSGSTWVSSGFDPTAPVAVGGDVLAGPKTANALGGVGTTLAPNWSFEPGTTTVGGDVIMDGSSTFGIIFLSSGGAFGAQVNYLLSNPFVFDTTSPEQGSWATATSTFTYGAPVLSGSVAANSWTPVPEPATAALALAGLAMLIRRRK